MSSSSLYLEDVVEETEITERNVKYWSQKYDLPVEKDGRRNVYPPRTVSLLRLIRLLSDSELFTHHFIRLQVQRALGNQRDDIDKQGDYQRVRDRARKILESIDSSLGDAVLPALEASGPRRRKSGSRRRARSGNDLDEGVL
jgi:DNA-binding transcriptional MerR regulator